MFFMNKEKWEIKKLEEVAQITMGQSPTSDTYNEEGNGIPFFQGNVDFGKTYPKIRVFTTKPTKIVGTNELLISVRAPIGAINISNCECCIGRGLAGIKPKENSLDLGFLTYTLKFHSQNLQEKGTGSTFKAINKNILTDLEIPIPPLSTQEKIVSELDTLHRLKELQEQQLAELDNLAQSTFYHLFGDPIENEKGWEVKKLGEFTRIINGRAYKQEELLKEGKTPVLRVGNFFSNKDFYYSNLELDKDKYCDYGDLLYAWSASFGAKIWDGGKVIYHYHIWKIEINESICNKIFLFNILNLKTNYLKEQTHGIAMLHLTKSGMEDTNFILPPLSLQTQFSERIEKIETQKELIKQSIGETQLLIDYTMDKYFG